MRAYYAQNKEDLLIKGFFSDVEKGFYIDVGANEPVLDSVTKLFYDSGWHGINIEPIPRHFEALKRERPNDMTLQIGLSDKAGELTFTEYPEGDGLSTFDSSMRDSYKQGNHSFPTTKTKEYVVPVRTLQTVIEETKPKHIHFIKIDVEGYEYEVINGYDWQLVRPELICIEANHIHKDWRPLLKKHAYELVFFDGVNNYYLAKESLHRKSQFNYPNIAFAGNPVYYPAVVEIEQSQERKAAEKNKALVARLEDLEQQVSFLHRQQRDVRFLAKQLAKETQLRLNKRAKGTKSTAHLSYEDSEALSQAVNNPKSDKQKLLATAHELDSKSINHRGVKLAEKTKPLFWKAAAGTLNTGIKVAKKAKHVR